jgi:hypothetical protein
MGKFLLGAMRSSDLHLSHGAQHCKFMHAEWSFCENIVRLGRGSNIYSSFRLDSRPRRAQSLTRAIFPKSRAAG